MGNRAGIEYTQLTKIGKGSFGEVFLLRHNKTKQLIACKKICLESLHERERDRMLKETEIMKLFQVHSHPNVVRLIAADVTSKELVVIYMEYCAKGDLRKKIEERRQLGQPFPGVEIMCYLYQIASGLAFIHEHRVVHRDLKPENILVDEQNDLKITDFGVSAVLSATHAQQNTMAGTMAYMAPEAIDEEMSQGPIGAYDVWSLGAITYELASLKLPFEGSNAAAIIMKILQSKDTPPEKLPAGVSSKVQELVNAMLIADPSQRPTSHEIVTRTLSDEDRNLITQWEQEKENDSYWQHSTVLHYATVKGEVRIVEALLTRGDDVNSTNEYGSTPLHWASEEGHKVVATLLLQKEANVNHKNNMGWTPLHRASNNGHMDVVNLLLGFGAKVNEKDKNGWTPLHMASCYGFAEIVDALIAGQAHLDEKTDEECYGFPIGSTPLHVASTQGREDVIRVLLRHKTDKGGRDSRGQTPRDVVCLSLLADKAVASAICQLLDE